MPPAKSSSTSLESLDPLELLDDAVWDLLKGAGLPPVAGGALPGFLEDAWNWTKGHFLDPGGAFLAGVLSELGRIVSGAVTTVLSWFLKWVYHIARFSLWYAIPSGHRLLYPSVYDESVQSPYMYLSRLWRMLGSVVEGLLDGPIAWVGRHVEAWVRWVVDQAEALIAWVGRHVEAWVRWVWDQVEAGLRWVWGHVETWGRWVWDKVEDARKWVGRHVEAWVRWVWDQVEGGIAWVGRHVEAWDRWVVDQAEALIAWVGRHVEAWGRWVWDQVEAGIAWVGRHVEAWGRWVWDQVEAGLKWAWDNVISKIPEGIVAGAAEIGKLIRQAFEWLVEGVFAPIADILTRKLAIPGKLVRGEYETMGEWVDDLLDPPPLTNFIKFLGWIAVGFLSILLAMSPALAPITYKWAQQTHEIVRDRLLEPRTVIEAKWRDYPVSHGYETHLARLGYTNEDIITMLDLGELIPGPSDLVRMGVREVFTPEIAEKFGQFEDFPPAFGDWMAQQGYKKEWARNWWAAHWDLPSVTQGFEMFHRDVISEGDLQLLLRALDVMPYWRDKLTEIAYRVITRVDVRRMYQESVFDRGQVLRVYKEQGYKPEDAEALTEFVVRHYPRKGAEEPDDLRSTTVTTTKQAYARRLITRDDALENLQELDYSPDDALLIVSIWEFDWTQDPSLRSDVDPKGLARSLIERAYERRLIDLNAGVRELGEMGYTAEDASLILELVDLRLEEKVADLEVDVILNDYDAGMITEGEMAARLAALHIPQARVDFLVRLEIVRRQGKTRRLTLAQLEEAFRKDQITEAEFRVRLDRMGYNPPDVGILVVQAGGSLTIGQLQAAYRRGALTEVELRTRLVELGVVGHDVDLLVPVAVRRPTVAQLQEAFRRGELAEGTFRDRLAELAVEPRDVDLLVAITPRLPSISDLRKAFDAGIITEAQLRARFAELGYGPGDVELLVKLTLEEE